MLTGRRPFDGSSPATVIAAIMERPAPSIGSVAPPALDRPLKRCLEKDPENRWQNARDLKTELEWIAQGPGDVSTVPTSATLRRPLPWIVVTMLAVVAACTSWISYRSTQLAELKSLVRLDVDLGHDVYLNALGGSDIILSSDGARIATCPGAIFSRASSTSREPPNCRSRPVRPAHSFSPIANGLVLSRTAS
jgi:serine/threonine-protein kinase